MRNKLEEATKGHLIKGDPRNGDWYCSCGYGFELDDDMWDTAEEHLARVIFKFLGIDPN